MEDEWGDALPNFRPRLLCEWAGKLGSPTAWLALVRKNTTQFLPKCVPLEKVFDLLARQLVLLDSKGCVVSPKLKYKGCVVPPEFEIFWLN